MRLRFPNLPDLGRAVVAVKHIRWRDPLVQVWGLIGVVLVTGMVAHYVRSGGGGEQKNTSWAAELLSVGEPDTWRPGVCFAGEGLATSADAPAEVDLRACAEAAAARKAWRFLPADIRQEIAGREASVRTVEVGWSGTGGGDAEALELYFTGVRDDAGGTPADFVIGNGRRGRDGGIETTGRWSSGSGAESGRLQICLVGDSARPTSAQLHALGEIITSIEARCGRVTLSMCEPQPPQLLANLD